jgi:parvulin-like peptidyl-prolyl isomerase
MVLTVACQKTNEQYLAKVNGEAIKVDNFLSTLPKGRDIETPEETFFRYQENLQKLINRRLFIQEAKRLDLMTQVKNSFALSEKTMITQKLFDKEIIEKAKTTSEVIRQLYDILPISVHLRLITVARQPDADLVEKQLQAGETFQSSAYKFSQHPSSKNGGDVGFGKLAFLPEPIRKAVESMKPGEISPPIPTDDGFAIVQLIEKKAEPVGSLAQEELGIQAFLEQQKAKELHRQFFAQLNSRLVYNHKALQVFFKPVNQITDQEKELWVVKKDETLMVRVKSLLQVAETFNPAIDTALRIFALKRAIEDDLLYEEALHRGLNKEPPVKMELAKALDELLYQAFYNQAINNQITVSDPEILEYYNTQRTNYPGGWNESVKDLIKNRILTDQKNRAEANLVRQLSAKAKIEINQNLLKSLVNSQKPKKEKK